MHAAALTLQVPPILHETTTTFAAPGTIKAVVARADMGSITVVPGSTHAIKFHQTWNYAKPTLTRSLSNGVLTVIARCPRDPTSFNKCSDDLAITVPSAVSVDAVAGFGDVVTKNLVGSERLRSSFGDIVASHITASAISTATDFGDIAIKVPAGTYAVTAKADWGEVHVSPSVKQDSHASRKISADSNYGDVFVSS